MDVDAVTVVAEPLATSAVRVPDRGEPAAPLAVVDGVLGVVVAALGVVVDVELFAGAA